MPASHCGAASRIRDAARSSRVERKRIRVPRRSEVAIYVEDQVGRVGGRNRYRAIGPGRDDRGVGDDLAGPGVQCRDVRLRLPGRPGSQIAQVTRRRVRYGSDVQRIGVRGRGNPAGTGGDGKIPALHGHQRQAHPNALTALRPRVGNPARRRGIECVGIRHARRIEVPVDIEDDVGRIGGKDADRTVGAGGHDGRQLATTVPSQELRVETRGWAWPPGRDRQIRQPAPGHGCHVQGIGLGGGGNSASALRNRKGSHETAWQSRAAECVCPSARVCEAAARGHRHEPQAGQRGGGERPDGGCGGAEGTVGGDLPVVSHSRSQRPRDETGFRRVRHQRRSGGRPEVDVIGGRFKGGHPTQNRRRQNAGRAIWRRDQNRHGRRQDDRHVDGSGGGSTTPKTVTWLVTCVGASAPTLAVTEMGG